MSKHTPAPWNVRRRAGRRYLYSLATGAKIATFNSELQDAEERANIDLFMTAPAMLEALEAIEANGNVMRLLQRQIDETGAHICGNVRAAIRAARGEG